MLGQYSFIGFLFCAGAAGLLVGGINLYERIDLSLNGRSAVMQLADPAKKISLGAPGGVDVYPLDVKYSGPDGEVVVEQKWLSRDRATKLANGEKIPVTYLKNNPKRTYYAGEKPDSPWGWLIVGVLALFTFFYAWKLKRRQAEEAE
jgi:hypothetical protein